MAKSKKAQFVNDPNKSRLFFDLMQAIKGYDPNEIAALAAKKANGDKKRMISPNTIRKWLVPIKDGGTIYPSSRTMEIAIRAVGGKIQIIPPEKTKHEKKHHNVDLIPTLVKGSAIIN